MTLQNIICAAAVRRVCATAALAVLLTSTASAQVTYTPSFTNIWTRASGSLGDLPSSGDTVRGFAVNPFTTNVIFVSRAGGSNHFSTLSAASGAYLGSGNTNGIAGGTFAVNGGRVADDGSVYVGSLYGGTGSQLNVYKYVSDTDFTSAPLRVFNGVAFNANSRVGDYMDLRGSGATTELIFTGSSSTNAVILRATDAFATNFTNLSIPLPGGAGSAAGGVTFEGTNNVFYCKAAGGKPFFRVTYNPTNLTSSVTHTFQMDQSFNNGLKYYSANGVQLIASVCTATTSLTNGIQHRAKVLQLNLATSNAVVVLDAALPTPNFANGNSIGGVDFRNGYAVFGEPNNGISLYNLGFVTNSPPTVSVSSTSGTFVEGFTNTLVSAAGGTPPLKYQWYFNTNTPIANATNSNYAFLVTTAAVGTYSVIVTNAYGSATSGVVTIGTVPNGASTAAGFLWKLAPGDVDYVTTTDTQRGLAYDPVTSNLVLVSRSPTNGLHILSSTTGAEIGQLDYSQIANLGAGAPGTYKVNVCGVADDGIVYAANLTQTSGSDAFAIYSWGSATDGAALLGQAYLGDAGLTAYEFNANRIGDTMAVRGAGVNTQIICSPRAGTNVVIFTTTDGQNFTPNVIAITNMPDSASGLGITWGSGNTFWTKSGFNLRQVQFDLVNLVGGVINSYPIPLSGAIVGIDNLQNFAAIIGTSENPANVSFYNLLPAGSVTLSSLFDREFYSTSFPNGNAVGVVAVDTAGSRLFALDTDNGILALKYGPRLVSTPTAQGAVLSWTGTGTLQSATAVIGPFTDVTGATNPYTNTAAAQIYFRLKH